MANPILNLLGGPLKGIIDSVGGLIDKVSTTDAERLTAKKELLEIQAKLYTAALESEATIAKNKADVIMAEANSQSWLARNWRPITALTLVFIIANNYIFAPLFAFPSLPTPDRLWDLIELCLGGYIASRGLEKIVPSVAQAFGDAKKPK